MREKNYRLIQKKLFKFHDFKSLEKCVNFNTGTEREKDREKRRKNETKVKQQLTKKKKSTSI